MLYPDVEFPITTGDIATFLRAELVPGWVGLIVAPKKPATMPRRFLSIRDDGGTQTGTTMSNRYGINVWAGAAAPSDNAWLDAENLARDAMTKLRRLPGVARFKSSSQFFGPIEIEDDPAFTYATRPMGHYYFSFAATVKGVQA